MAEQNDEAVKVRLEQVRLLYSTGLTLVVINMIAAGLFLYIDQAWMRPLNQAWGFILGLVLVAQLLLTILVRHVSIERLRPWRYAFLPGVLLLGILWALALMHLMAIGTHSTQPELGIALIALVFMLTTAFLTIDSFFSFLFVLSAAVLWIINPLGFELSLTPGFWSGLTAYLLGLLILASWLVANQQRLLLITANRTLLHERIMQSENELNEMRSQLSMENDQRQSVELELFLAKEAAETANLAKSEFLATMSHEIRTPLNGILPILEMLRETRLNDEQREFVTTALNSSQLLLSIINDILDFSKIEAGKLDLEFIEVNIRDMVEQVTALMRNAADRRGLKLEYKIADDVPGSVRGDPIRLRQILTNLVSNAVKFTEKGEVAVEVSHRKSLRTEVELLFAVRDSGVGMSKEQVQRLFEPFSQADASTTRKHGGTGLGLVICKRLTELMGGQIGVKSQQGRGSYFWFLVPLRKSLHEIPSARRDLSGLKTLILADKDDEQISRLTQCLRDWGMLFELASNHYDALSKLKSSAVLGATWRYQLVLVDGSMNATILPQLIENARKLPHMEDVEFMVFNIPDTRGVAQEGRTGNGPKDGVNPFEALGVELLKSPVKRNELERRLKRLFDVEQASSWSVREAEAPVPRLPDDHLGWEDQQSESMPHGIVSEGKGNPPTTAHTVLVGRVLVVEDNPVNQAVVKKMLEKAGLTPVTANDGVEAMQAIEQETFDVVLMDCQMPRMDGYKATNAIRERERQKGLLRLPVIAMTANAMAGDRERCLDAGMDDYLSKPVKPAGLETMLRQWLPMQEVLEGEAIEAGPGAVSAVGGTGDQSREGGDNLSVVEEVKAMSTSVLDMTVLEELYEIMEDDFVSVLQSFLDNAPSLMQGIKSAVKQNDLDALAGSAHSLKSSSANVGAMKLSIFARELEFKGRQKDAANLLDIYQQIVEIYRRTMAELGAIVERGSLH